MNISTADSRWQRGTTAFQYDGVLRTWARVFASSQRRFFLKAFFSEMSSTLLLGAFLTTSRLRSCTGSGSATNGFDDDRARATSSFRMDGQNSELVKQQVQAELANAYAQEFFTVRMPDLVLDLFPTLPLVPPPPPPGPRC